MTEPRFCHCEFAVLVQFPALRSRLCSYRDTIVTRQGIDRLPNETEADAARERRGALPQRRHIVLLPGLDGTGLLFEDFVRLAPVGVQLHVVPLPADVSDYARLAEVIGPRIARRSPAPILLAESFSGPLAIELAARHDVAELILCNSFAVAPYPRVLRALIQPGLFRRRLPQALVRRYLVGRSASDELVERVRVVIATVPAPTLAARLRNVLSVDVRPSLAKCKVPILYLRGTEDRIIRDVSMKALVEAATIRVKVNQIAAPHLLLQVAPKQAWSAIQERELITQ